MNRPTNSSSQLTNGSVRIVTSESTQVGPSTRIVLAAEAVEGLELLDVVDDLAEPVASAASSPVTVRTWPASLRTSGSR